ncbi:HAD-IIB family hydrolase [Gordonia pseudamarae]|jgi:phosphomannomutase|uniref:phosphomannomutase n=1 Tax=Gordonia pseudamarae TaxID=2831662 RepID=A0ABX6IH01_9ACTN|nr:MULTISPECIES: HAD-IIB family hydrolase [Gordonia]MBD0020949.1 HAD-IIB family hydrolase [Gordonia sp. (in: high G+C Gram-positive bacteria)]QHN26201.1 HAD-IIB family hydrolase [Gordonia pseudamarae]QHN35094.1 HAD-IIB family hydrolase [Gordonia pseudamarae]
MAVEHDGNTYRLVMFDLDDTLAPSKSPLPDEMATQLRRLLDRGLVCIISGGQFGQFDTQVLSRIGDDPNAANLHLMPTCGTQYVRLGDSGWETVYAEYLSDEEKSRTLAVLETGAKTLGLWEDRPWGPILEDRGSQITYSALGQSAPVDAKAAWDPDGAKKESLRAYAAERLPDLEVRSGGSTSVDITRKGIDKAYGARRLMEILGLATADILFYGDRLDEGGNDRPVADLGITSIAVEGWRDTYAKLDELLSAAG